MSPNEFQLRAALREGEGEALDPDRMIARAVAASRERRTRIGSIAAAAAIVAGIGVGGGLMIGGNDGSTSTGSAAGNLARSPAASVKGGDSVQSGVATSAPRAASRAVPGSGATKIAEAIACPPAAPRLLLPGGGGTGQFGGSGSLFSAPVAAAKVCGYPDGGAVRSGGSQVVSGQPAADLAASLNAAAKQPVHKPCPSTPASSTPRLVVIAVSAAGQRMEPVVVTIACNGTSTNGTAVRYDWSPPSYLAGLASAVPGGDTTLPIYPDGKLSGSPQR